MADGKERLQLTRALASRHIFMLSLGGVIGTGLFMGSGVTINQGGRPARCWPTWWPGC